MKSTGRVIVNIDQDRRQVLIIGGGAAGLFCAGLAARRGFSVVVLERNQEVGKKLSITGKGRCNVTNNCSVQEFMANVRSGGKFLFSAARAFSPENAMDFFEHLGIPLKTERGRRVFPVSDRAADVVHALKKYARDGGAQIETGSRVARICVRGDMVYGVALEDGRQLSADTVVLATGGCSYPATGSTGDGFEIAKALGHEIVQPRPSLVALYTQETWPADVMGLSLRNVELTLRDAGGKAVFCEQGEMLFTHFGVSGPLVLSASAHIRGNPKDYSLAIDLKPALDEARLDARILRDFDELKNKNFINALSGLLPKALIEPVVRLSGIPADEKVHSITRAQRQTLTRLLKALPLKVRALGPVEQAVVTAGGVSLKEVNPSTMESKLVKNLFFTGEILDLDAFTGGYNLQIAWCTAYAAAMHI